jgi:uncharacterized protein with LGFP repeats
MEAMGSARLTRRSLLAAMAAVMADGLARPHPALAQLAGPRPRARTAGLPLAGSGLPADPGQPPIIARAAWARGVAHPRVAPEYGTVQLAFVHHTENPDGYGAAEVPAMLRSIYRFHRYTRGWNDIGYNFVIDRFGRIFEARGGGIDEPVIGAHAGGYNAYSTGIAILGTYGAQRISTAARRALERLLAWKLSLHGAPLEGRVTVRVTPGGAVYSRYPANTPVSLPRVAGHRDGDSTDCPGDALYGQLQEVRRAAHGLAGTPARLTLHLQAPREIQASGTLAGTLALLDGTALANAPVAIQMRIVARRGETVWERTVAQAITGPGGEWSLPVLVSHEGLAADLRAVFSGPGAPATVSDSLSLPGSVSFSPASQAPVPIAPESPSPSA